MSEAAHSSAEALLDEIEGEEFAAQVNLASSYRQARQIALAHRGLAALIGGLRTEPAFVEATLRRAWQLVGRDIDPAYESPYDAALMGIYLALNEAVPSSAPAAQAVILGARQTWWARKAVQQEPRTDAALGTDDVGVAMAVDAGAPPFSTVRNERVEEPARRLVDPRNAFTGLAVAAAVSITLFTPPNTNEKFPDPSTRSMNLAVPESGTLPVRGQMQDL